MREQLFRMARQLSEREFSTELGRGDFKKTSDLILKLKEELQDGISRDADKLNESQEKATREQLSRMARQLNDVVIRMARLEWKRAVYLATIIGNPTYRNEMLYKVADTQASGSASIATAYLRTVAVESVGDVQPLANSHGNDPLVKTADTILVESFDVAKKIDRLIWKYRAMVQIAIAAADSQQYAQDVELSRGIDNGESRAEAMLVLAESQCRSNQNDAATVAYQEAAGGRHGFARRTPRRSGQLRGREYDGDRALRGRSCLHRALPTRVSEVSRARRHRRVAGTPRRGGIRSRVDRAGSPRTASGGSLSSRGHRRARSH